MANHSPDYLHAQVAFRVIPTVASNVDMNDSAPARALRDWVRGAGNRLGLAAASCRFSEGIKDACSIA